MPKRLPYVASLALILASSCSGAKPTVPIEPVDDHRIYPLTEGSFDPSFLTATIKVCRGKGDGVCEREDLGLLMNIKYEVVCNDQILAEGQQDSTGGFITIPGVGLDGCEEIEGNDFRLEPTEMDIKVENERVCPPTEPRLEKVDVGPGIAIVEGSFEFSKLNCVKKLGAPGGERIN